ncbi:MAG: hypothetical protein MJY52_05125 [Bacteroidaceae bacterium]|nr:hypothetical protein [Bacteroidaceae bacterium]
MKKEYIKPIPTIISVSSEDFIAFSGRVKPGQEEGEGSVNADHKEDEDIFGVLLEDGVWKISGK